MRLVALFGLLLVDVVSGDVLNGFLKALDINTVLPSTLHFPIETEPTIEPAVGNETETKQDELCTWANFERECVPSDNIKLVLVEQSDSELAKVYTPFLKRRLGRYSWKERRRSNETREVERVTAADVAEFLETQSSSPCYRNASLLWNFTKLGKECKKHRHKKDCVENTFCSWTWRGWKCSLDYWQLLYGVKSVGNVPKGVNKVLSINAKKFTEAFDEEFGEQIKSIDFNWNVTLDWEGPEFVCPKGIAQLVCDYAKPFTKSFPDAMYCAGKHPDPFVIHECQTDDNCEPSVDGDPVCIPSGKQLIIAATEAYEVFLENIEDPFMRELFYINQQCREQKSWWQCASGYYGGLNCRWNQKADMCDVGAKWIAERLAKPDDPDALCRLFAIPLHNATCIEKIQYWDCDGQIDTCEWNRREGTCETKVDVYLDEISEEDPKFKEMMKEIKSLCEKRSEEYCTTPPPQ